MHKKVGLEDGWIYHRHSINCNKYTLIIDSRMYSWLPKLSKVLSSTILAGRLSGHRFTGKIARHAINFDTATWISKLSSVKHLRNIRIGAHNLKNLSCSPHVTNTTHWILAASRRSSLSTKTQCEITMPKTHTRPTKKERYQILGVPEKWPHRKIGTLRNLWSSHSTAPHGTKSPGSTL